MNEQIWYLKQNVVAEPLFGKWYAWSYLISPATAAMFVANYHLKVMNSFVAAPQIHQTALKNPTLIGGPFINYGADRANEIKDLINETKTGQAELLEFAEAVGKLNKMLEEEADGSSLEKFYAQIPEPLKGYVELIYDLNNQPSVRFIEGLLYRSGIYDETRQGILLSLAEKEDERDFVFSTPRLPEKNQIYISEPFRSAKLDRLSAMKNAPDSVSEIKTLLGVKDEDEKLFESFFTIDAPPKSEKFAGDGVRVRYFGHACLLVETENTSVLCDPVVSYQFEDGIARYTFADLPETIDYLLITHNHQDHCMFETLLPIRHKVKTVVVPKNNGGGLADPSLKLLFKAIGFPNVVELDEMEMIETADGAITGLPFFGEHGDLNIRTKLAFHLKLQGKSIICAADSNNFEPRLYRHLHDILGDTDIVFIGMECDGAPLSWLYGSLITKPIPRKIDQSRRFDGSNYEKANALISELNPKQVYVYAMGQEPWLKYLTSIEYTADSRPIIESDKLVAECRRQGRNAERLFGQKEIVLSGETFSATTKQ